MNKVKTGHSKARDERPARDRYWRTLRLCQNKVAHITKSSGCTPDEALVLWHSQRKGRMR